MVGGVSLAISIIASSTYSGFAKNVSSALSPLTLLFVAQLLIVFFIFLSFGALPSMKRLSSLNKKQFVPLVLLGVLNGVVAPLLWFTGIESTTAVNAALFGKMEAFFLLPFAAIFLGERLRLEHFLSTVIIFFGILMVVLQGFHVLELTFASGDLLILLASFVFATGSMLYRMFLHGVSPELVILWRSFTGIASFFLIAPFLPYTLGSELLQFPLWLIPALLGFCFISQFLNLFSFYQAVDRLPISTISLCLSFEVIGSALFAHLYLNEPFYWYHIIGGACILFGILLLECMSLHSKHKKSEEHLVHAQAQIVT